jgi:CDP-paratose 2-epimerase
MLGSLVDHPLKVKFDDVRPGDQLIYVSDNWRALSLLDWKPQVSVKEGIEALFQWIKANSALFSVT